MIFQAGWRGRWCGMAAAVVGLAAGAPAVSADVIGIQPNITTGTQVFDNTFGIDFNVNATAVNVTQLGVFDNAGDGVLLTDSPTQPIVIQVWDRDTGIALASASFAGGTGNGTQATVGAGKVFFKPLTVPLTLTAGGHYYISEDFAGTEKFGNVGNAGYVNPTTNDGGGLISFVGKGRASNGHNIMFNGSDAASGGTSAAPAPPATSATSGPGGFLDGGPAARYTGPNFQFAAVPEPASAGLLGVAAVGLLARRRRGSTPRAAE